MSKTTIVQIREAEKNAEVLIGNAEAEARRMRAEAEEKAKAFCDANEKSVAEELAGMTAKINDRAAELISRAEAEAKEEADALEASVRVARKAAEDAVFGRLMEKCR